MSERLRLVEEACAGVAAMHSGGRAHRDLKLENLLVFWDGEAERPTLRVADPGVCHMDATTGRHNAGDALWCALCSAPCLPRALHAGVSRCGWAPGEGSPLHFVVLAPSAHHGHCLGRRSLPEPREQACTVQHGLPGHRTCTPLQSAHVRQGGCWRRGTLEYMLPALLVDPYRAAVQDTYALVVALREALCPEQRIWDLLGAQWDAIKHREDVLKECLKDVPDGMRKQANSGFLGALRSGKMSVPPVRTPVRAAPQCCIG